jgi:hypothetical protein
VSKVNDLPGGFGKCDDISSAVITDPFFIGLFVCSKLRLCLQCLDAIYSVNW